MRALSRHILSVVFSVICVFALVISCGLPEALHELGHSLTHSTCDEQVERAPNSLTARTSLDACWLQAALASVAQFSGISAAFPKLETLAVVSFATLSVPDFVIISRDIATWHLSRGPPRDSSQT
jgi:hypothetical protein